MHFSKLFISSYAVNIPLQKQHSWESLLASPASNATKLTPCPLLADFQPDNKCPVFAFFTEQFKTIVY